MVAVNVRIEVLQFQIVQNIFDACLKAFQRNAASAD